ncbi:hypothetical protein [Lentilactobacillus kisonensis]|uniref:Uncharacterized protein n=2 Tax=Lentilactobacillus kisonensis TaxID=481722 RepID=A0A0R1P1T6_9LACO|nr:hypothetical protein [Lentilactobacillus kisonensis]KRL23027.1 hypothetical protein FC98_GL001061 [Lentilactobacillus kisonensis DSM 19906 = JCM 15041]
MDNLQQLQSLNHLSLQTLATKIGISLPTMKKVMANGPIAKRTEAKVAEFLHKNVGHARLFLDETYYKATKSANTMSLSCVLIKADNACDSFRESMYPLGWRPGDEVKAAGKDIDTLVNLLSTVSNDDIQAFYTKTLTTYDDIPELKFICPYIVTILETLTHLQFESINHLDIFLDMRNEFSPEALSAGSQLLKAFLKLMRCQIGSLQLIAKDSRNFIGLQYADFVANLSMRAKETQLTTAKITSLTVNKSERNQMLLTLSGLQQRIIRHHRVASIPANPPQTIKYLLECIREVAYRERTSQNRSSFGQLKQAMQLCTDQLPKADQHIILNAKASDFIDMEARACIALHSNLNGINLKTRTFNQIMKMIDAK